MTQQSLRGWPSRSPVSALKKPRLERSPGNRTPGDLIPFPTPKRSMEKQIQRQSGKIIRRTLGIIGKAARLHPLGRAIGLASDLADLYDLWAAVNKKAFGFAGYVQTVSCDVTPVPMGKLAFNPVCGLADASNPKDLNYDFGFNPDRITVYSTETRWGQHRTLWGFEKDAPPYNSTTPSYGKAALPTLSMPGLQYFPDLVMPGTFANPLPLSSKDAAAMPFDDPEIYQGRHREMIKPRPFRFGRVHLKPSEVPAVVTTLNISVNSQTGAFESVSLQKNPQGKHVLKKPPHNVREQKFSGKTGAIHYALAKYGVGPTEWLDLLDVFYQALPEKIQSDPRYHGSVGRRFQAVYDNFDKLDWDKVVENYIKNEVEDRIAGRLNQRLDKKMLDKFNNPHDYYRLKRGYFDDMIPEFTFEGF